MQECAICFDHTSAYGEEAETNMCACADFAVHPSCIVMGRVIGAADRINETEPSCPRHFLNCDVCKTRFSPTLVQKLGPLYETLAVVASKKICPAAKASLHPTGIALCKALSDMTDTRWQTDRRLLACIGLLASALGDLSSGRLEKAHSKLQTLCLHIRSSPSIMIDCGATNEWMHAATFASAAVLVAFGDTDAAVTTSQMPKNGLWWDDGVPYADQRSGMLQLAWALDMDNQLIAAIYVGRQAMGLYADSMGNTRYNTNRINLNLTATRYQVAKNLAEYAHSSHSDSLDCKQRRLLDEALMLAQLSERELVRSRGANHSETLATSALVSYLKAMLAPTIDPLTDEVKRLAEILDVQNKMEHVQRLDFMCPFPQALTVKYLALCHMKARRYGWVDYIIVSAFERWDSLPFKLAPRAVNRLAVIRGRAKHRYSLHLTRNDLCSSTSFRRGLLCQAAQQQQTQILSYLHGMASANAVELRKFIVRCYPPNKWLNAMTTPLLSNIGVTHAGTFIDLGVLVFEFALTLWALHIVDAQHCSLQWPALTLWFTAYNTMINVQPLHPTTVYARKVILHRIPRRTASEQHEAAVLCNMLKCDNDAYEYVTSLPRDEVMSITHLRHVAVNMSLLLKQMERPIGCPKHVSNALRALKKKSRPVSLPAIIKVYHKCLPKLLCSKATAIVTTNGLGSRITATGAVGIAKMITESPKASKAWQILVREMTARGKARDQVELFGNLSDHEWERLVDVLSMARNVRAQTRLSVVAKTSVEDFKKKFSRDELAKAVASELDYGSMSVIEAELNAAVGQPLSSGEVRYSLCDIACTTAVTRYVKDCLVLDKKLWDFYNHIKLDMHLSGYVLCSSQSDSLIVKDLHPVCMHWERINWKTITADFSENKTMLKVATWQKESASWSVAHNSARFVGFVRRRENELILPTVRLMANATPKPAAIVVAQSSRKHALATHRDGVSDIDVPTYWTSTVPQLDALCETVYFKLQPEPGTRRATEFDTECCYYAPMMYK